MASQKSHSQQTKAHFAGKTRDVRKRKGMKSGEIEQEKLPEERNPEPELQQESEESDIDCFSGEDDETTTEEGEDALRDKMGSHSPVANFLHCVR